MTISTIYSKLLARLPPDLVSLYSIISWSVLWENWITVLKVKVTVKVQNVSECLSGWYLLNTSNPFFKTSLAVSLFKNPVQNLNRVLQFFLENLPTLSFWTFDCLLSIQTTSLYLRHENLLLSSHKTKTFGEWAFFSQAQNSGTHCHKMSVTRHP